MKSFISTAVAFLLGLAISVAAIPTPDSFDNSCVRDDCVNAADNELTLPDSAFSWKNDFQGFDDQELDELLVKRVDQGTSEAEATTMKCDIVNKCPMGYHYVDRGTRCHCFPMPGGFKREANLATSEEAGGEASDSRVPFDPHVYCANSIKCGSGSAGLWDNRIGRCYCGPRRANVDDLIPREEADSRVPFDPRVYCANQTKCPSGSAGLWDSRAGRCYCGPRRANVDLNTRVEAEASQLQSNRTARTTAYLLTSRLLEEPQKFPTSISYPDWTAIQATLALLREYIKLQSDLHQVCTGAKNPQAFGFKLEIFRRICAPEITVPVAQPEIAKAESMVNSALFIDTILQRNNNNFGGACSEAKSPGVIPSPLDSQWILFVLCHQGH